MTMAQERQSGRDRAISVWKALQILDSFHLSTGVLGITELSRRLNVAKSTAHRLCTTLVEAGYLEVTGDHQYRLGVRLFELGNQVSDRVGIRHPAATVLHWLAEVTHENVHLAVRDGLELLYVSKVEPPGARPVPSLVGTRQPLYCTGLGKAMLAWAPADILDEVIARKLEPYTAYTITDPAHLKEELQAIRRRGVSVDFEER